MDIYAEYERKERVQTENSVGGKSKTGAVCK